MVDGVWNWGERPTNIDFVPSTNLFPNRGSLFELTGGETGAARCGDVGWGDVIDRTISGPGCLRGGGPGLDPGIVGATSGIREVEKLGVVSGGELGMFFVGGGVGLGMDGSSNGGINVGFGAPLG